MSMPVDHSPTPCSRRLLATALLLAWPLLASAQSAAPTTPHHAHGTSPATSSGTGHHALHATKPQASDPAVDHVQEAAGTSAMPTQHAHDSNVAGELRGPDYSDGIGRGSMPGVHMLDDQPLAMLRVDQLEATHGRYANGQAWAVQGWYGNDGDKLWLRSEGERSRGRIDHGQVELLWNHAVAPFWDTQLGVRQDVGHGPQRRWAAFGVQGLAPYWFELEATVYAGPSGRTAARLRAEYELLFTQRLILQPEVELNLHGRNDMATRTGHGLSDTRLGLRLRYEIRRELAPYIGVVWTHRYGATADYARQNGESATDRQFVAGVRFWF
jgi:copper resistance protein B